MGILQPVKPGLSAPIVTSIPNEWSAAWFRNFITNYLQNADIRNATASGSVTVTSTNQFQAPSIDLAEINPYTVLGNATEDVASPEALSQAQLTALINIFGVSTSGAVPKAPIQDPRYFLNATGAFTIPATAAPAASTGPASYWIQPDDGEDTLVIPGPIGLQGATGAAGAPGVSIMLYPDDPDDPQVIPGPPGTGGGGGGSGANPTATIGLTVVNGSATTFMRSDAAPPLSQAIAPTWTGNHTFNPGSGIGVTVNGVSGSWTQDLYASGSTGNSYGLRMHAGTNNSDYAIQVINGGYSAVLFELIGDGSGQIGPGTSLSLKWDASGNFTFPAKISLNAPTSGIALSVPGANGYYALQVVGSNTTGGSDGLEINAGTNSSDNALLITNQGLSATFVQIYGDGSGRIGPSHSVSMQWTTAGAFSFPGSISLSAPTSGVALTVPGANGSYALQVEANNTTGGAFGLEINAGTNSSDNALLITNQGLSATFMQIAGDGSGKIGPASSDYLTWDTSGNFTFPQTVTVNAPSGGATALTVNGEANQFTCVFQGSTTSGQSFGPIVRSGTNSSDQAFRVRNAAATVTYFTVQGDGSFAFYNGTPALPLTGFGSPSGSVTAGLTSSATLAQTAGTLAALLAWMKGIGFIGA